jgi:hypothetical protein
MPEGRWLPIGVLLHDAVGWQPVRTKRPAWNDRDEPTVDGSGGRQQGHAQQMLAHLLARCLEQEGAYHKDA